MRSDRIFIGKLQKIQKTKKKLKKILEKFFLILFLVILLSKLVFSLFNLLWLSNCRIFTFFSFSSSNHTVWPCNATFVFYFVQKISDFIFLMRTMLPRKKMLKRSSNSGWGKPKREKWNFDESNVFENQEVLRSSNTVKSDFEQEKRIFMRSMLPQIWL